MVPEGWSKANIGSISTTVTSGSRDWAQYYSESGAKFIRMTNLSRDGIHLKLEDLKYVDVHSDSADGKRTQLRRGDILISITAELGKIGIVPPGLGEAYINQHTALVRVDPKKACSTFVAYLLSSEKLNRQINKMNDSGAKAGLNLPTICSIPLVLPPLPEQNEVVRILETWDQAIKTTENLIQNIQAQKSGLMERLLTGKAKFAVSHGEQWKSVRLGDVFDERVENNCPTLPLLSITREKGVIPQEDVGRKITANEDRSKYKRICPGDIGYNTMRMWQGVSALSSLEGIVSPAYTIITPKHEIDAAFASYLFKLPRTVHDFRRYSQGLTSDTWNLKYPLFSEIKVRLPSIDEQRSIAALLSAIDSEISLLNQQLCFLNDEKRALMQQLLTGKRRVKVDERNQRTATA